MLHLVNPKKSTKDNIKEWGVFWTPVQNTCVCSWKSEIKKEHEQEYNITYSKFSGVCIMTPILFVSPKD